MKDNKYERRTSFKQYNKIKDDDNKEEIKDISDNEESVKEVRRSFVDKKKETPKDIFNGTAKVTAIRLAVRREPNGEILTTVLKDDTVTVDSSYNGGEWVKIIAPEEGYVMAKYLYKDK